MQKETPDASKKLSAKFAEWFRPHVFFGGMVRNDFWEPWVQKSLNKDQQLFWSREIWCLSGRPTVLKQRNLVFEWKTRATRKATNRDKHRLSRGFCLNRVLTNETMLEKFMNMNPTWLVAGFVHQQGTAFWKLAFLDVRRFLSHPYLSNVTASRGACVIY